MPGLGLLDPVEHVVDHRLVEAGLLPGQVAQHVHLDLLGQVGDDRAVGLEPPEHERPGEPLQRGRRRLVAVALDRHGEAFAGTSCSVPSRPGVEEVHERPQLEEAVLDRGAGEGHPAGGGQRPGRPVRPGSRVLHVLGLVEGEAAPGELGQEVAVPGEERVGGDDQVGPADGGQVSAARPAVRAVVDEDRETGGEAGRLPLPVADQ